MGTVKNVQELFSRSVSQILPSKEAFFDVLSSERKLRIYIGADATGPKLHLGHATNFMLLEKFRKMGHQVIILFGDFTAMIGDPTDKNATRAQLTREQVEENIVSWKEQINKVLALDDAENPVLVVRNSEWLSGLDFEKMIDLASSFTVQQMLDRDMFKKRILEERPIYVHEFFYPLMQGYDSVVLDVDVEIGGTDQTFNMLAGRTLQRKYNNREKFVITTTLLENPLTGKKLMSKSEGNFIALNDSAREMFGKTMALPDEAVISVLTDCTYVSSKEILEMNTGMKEGSMNPRDVKIRLAKELVTIYHDKESAELEERYFIETFSKKNVQSENVSESIVQWVNAYDAYENIINFLVRVGFANSKSDARRKMDQGGVSLDGERETVGTRILDPEKDNGKILRVGKKNIVKIIFEKRK